MANNNSAAVVAAKENAVAKRLSIAHLQHPSSLQSLHQLHQMHPHHNLMAAHQHHQQLMWHARSYESGIGKGDSCQKWQQGCQFCKFEFNFDFFFQTLTWSSHPIVTCTDECRCRRGVTFRHHVPCTSANGIRLRQNWLSTRQKNRFLPLLYTHKLLYSLPSNNCEVLPARALFEPTLAKPNTGFPVTLPVWFIFFFFAPSFHPLGLLAP